MRVSYAVREGCLDVVKMVSIVIRHLVEFVLQRANSGFAMHKLQMTVLVIMTLCVSSVSAFVRSSSWISSIALTQVRITP